MTKCLTLALRAAKTTIKSSGNGSHVANPEIVILNLGSPPNGYYIIGAHDGPESSAINTFWMMAVKCLRQLHLF
jgi:hypothetical protein